MEVLRSVSELSSAGPAYLAIGVFDGVHLGHQAVIARAVEDSRREPHGSAVVVTFDPHPLRGLRAERAPRLLTSPDGVYAARARLDGKTYAGVVNLGQRPTVAQPGGERLLELHLFDFDREIYGQEVEVSFCGFLRGEKKFGGVEELRAQIARDAAAARERLRVG